jgi:4'-phosphopantetheinyl transferase
MNYSLPLDTVHLWILDETKPPAPLETLRSWLSPEERARHQRFYFSADRDRFLLAHGALRFLLFRYLGEPPESWQFSTNAQGKPALAPPSWLRFNLSHTRGMIALLLARDREVGVDIEARRDTATYLSIARRHFAPAEVAQLEMLPREAQPAQFLRYWSLKESYIKARGLGLSLPLDKFWFRFSAPDEPELCTDPSLQDDPARWCCWLSWPSPRHALAACAARHPGEPLARQTRWLRSLSDEDANEPLL